MSRTRIDVTVSDWETLSHSVTEETMGDSPELKVFHDQLQAFLTEFQQLSQQQAFHAARKQEATRQASPATCGLGNRRFHVPSPMR